VQEYLLNLLSDGKVALESQGPSQPGVIRPIGSKNYVHVVMPMCAMPGGIVHVPFRIERAL
jgi:hypothetical protein